MNEEHQPKVLINSNTYISFGLLALVAGGLWAILSGISSTKGDIESARKEINFRFEKMEGRMSSLESTKNVWTATDMFKWAVHLQQANPNLKVPEPEVNTK